MADNVIDLDTPDVSLKVEFVQTDTLVLPFTKPGTAAFAAEPTAFIVEDTKKSSTIKKLTIGDGLTVVGDTLTMTIAGSSLECYIGRTLYVIMSIINAGKRDVIIALTLKYAPE